MNNKEFLSEISEYIKNEYLVFNEYQDITIQSLVEFDRVCRQHNIPYFLIAGTLLGFIRDKQNVPWDYDVDVAVTADYRETLLQALEESLGDDFYYAYTNNTSDYPTSCLRIIRKGYGYMALHVDVFFYVGLEDSPYKQKRMIKRIQKWTKLRGDKFLSNYLPDDRLDPIRKLIHSIKQLLYLDFISKSRIEKNENRIFNDYPFEDSNCCVSVCYAREKIVFPSEMFRHAIDINTKQGTFSVPQDYETYLRMVFGDYMQYYPIRTRFEEFYEFKHLVDIRQNFYLSKIK